MIINSGRETSMAIKPDLFMSEAGFSSIVPASRSLNYLSIMTSRLYSHEIEI
ncbi:MAG TPA: hypothetical protein PLR88_12470 [Bacteroidales bacterium]|nr:hypothetical protein [Bacteroidales bacterium]